MKIKMLPNWCKRLGLAVFIISGIVSFYLGWASVDCSSAYFLEPLEVKNQNLEMTNLYARVTDLSGIISVVGVFIYMLSKEKVEDDYIKILRLESFQLISLIGVIAIIIIYFVFGNISFQIDSILNLFMIFYLIIFAIKKRIY